MRRRRVLAALGVGVAGCVESPGGAGTPTDDSTPPATATETPTPTPTSVADASLERLGDCAETDTGTDEPTIGDGTATVEGCVRGRTGCSVPELVETTYDEPTDTLRAIVRMIEDGDACTQQIVFRRYRITVSYTGPDPAGVTVTREETPTDGY